ncbi:MAG: hypothetical protein ABI395_11580 [Sphingobium sp.]
MMTSLYAPLRSRVLPAMAMVLLASGAGVRAQDTAAPAPASAPAVAPGGERISQVIVYGNDACAPGQGDEIVVCVRQAESERYRIPPNLRDNPAAPQNQAWLNRAKAIEYVGRSGTQSCSPTGAGGFTGCFAQIAADAKAERKQLDNVHWADLVAAERAKRLGTIDADSKEIEARVKAEEAVDKAKNPAPAQ